MTFTESPAHNQPDVPHDTVQPSAAAPEPVTPAGFWVWHWNRQRQIKWLVVASLVLAGFVCGLGWAWGFTPQRIRQAVQACGVLAPLAFVGLFTLAPLVPFFSLGLTIAGGLLFGLWQGSVLVALGVMSAASAGFWLARQHGDWLRARRRLPGLDRFARVLGKRGWPLVLALRLTPLMPFDVICYGAGASSISYWAYLLATLCGCLPGIVVYANIGANALAANTHGLYWAVGLLGALGLFTWLLAKRIQKRFGDVSSSL